MKIYIAVDMEGVSGVNSPEHVKTDGRLYAEGRRLLTREVNAAVAGAFDAGADEVIVADMHGGSNNLLTEDVDSRALLLVGAPHAPRLPFLDGEVDGMALLGYHAMAGTRLANLEHTMTSAAWHSFRVNGEAWGEVAIDAKIASEAGVPVIMVSGDDRLCREADAFLPGVERACVKHGAGRQTALCLSPARGNALVRETMKRAVLRLKRARDFVLMPEAGRYTVSITYKFTPDADAATARPGARRVDGYTVENDVLRVSDLYGGLWSEYGETQAVH